MTQIPLETSPAPSKPAVLARFAWKTLLLCLMIMAASTSSLFAQVTTGAIVGTVTDGSGAILPGATITLKSLDTGTVQTTQASSSGEYSFSLLQIGRYTVSVSMPNFRSFKIDQVALAAGDRTRLNAALTVGSISETVEVNDAPASVQTDSATLGTLIDTKAVQDLPVNGRNVFSLVSLTPGVTSGATPGGSQSLSSGTRPDDRRQSSSYSANGQDPSNNNNLIDGADNNERIIGTIGVRPSLDAIAEVKVQTNLYSAEVGRTSGGVVNIITKSGTNKFHGTAFEYFRNDKFDANAYYNFTQSAVTPPAKQKLRQNQFGGSLGGPIFKDKTFFFGDYEGLRTIQGGTVTGVIVPTALQRVGNFSESCTSGFTAGICNTASQQLSLLSAVGTAPAGPVPNNRLDQGAYAANRSSVGLALAALYPLPSSAGVSTANYVATGNKTYFGHTFDVKIDHHFNEKNTLRGRYSYNQVGVFIPTLFPDAGNFNPGSGITGINGGFPGPNQTKAQNLLLNYVRVIKPNVLLDLTASYLRNYINSKNINYGKNVAQQLGIPGVNTADLQTTGLNTVNITGFQGIGDSSFTPLLQIDNSFEYKFAVSWAKGAHNIKVGGGFIRRQFNIGQSSAARGTFTFNTSGTPVSGPAAPLADLVLGIPATLSRTISPFISEYRAWEPNGYVQDDWRATKWLTLNLGLRYDVFTPKTEVRDRVSNLNIYTGQVLYPGINTTRTGGITSSMNGFAPRIGFSATVARDLVVRGGYGVSFFPNDINSGSLLKNPPFSPSLTCGPSTNTPCSTYGNYGTLSQGFFLPTVNFSTTNLASGLTSISIAPGAGFTALDQNFRTAYQQQFNVIVEKGIGKNTVSVGYVGVVGRNLALSLPDVNRALPSGNSTPNPRPLLALNPNLGVVAADISKGIGSYNALQVTYLRRLSKGLSVNSGYTYAHEIDDVPGYANTTSGGGGTLIGPQSGIVANVQKYDRATGDFNIGNRGFLAVNYDLPKANVGRALAEAINGWQVNGTAVWQSGLPFTVTNLNTRAGVTGLTGERPDRALSNVILGTRTYTNLGIGYLNPAAFAPQALYTLGNAGRNLSSGPSSSVINMSLFKKFQLPHESDLQFRTEVFNLPNHRNFGQPVSTLGSPNFGAINTVSAGDSPRQIQFALKLEF